MDRLAIRDEHFTRAALTSRTTSRTELPSVFQAAASGRRSFTSAPFDASTSWVCSTRFARSRPRRAAAQSPRISPNIVIAGGIAR